MFSKTLFLCALSLFVAHASFADEADDNDFNPFAPNVEATLNAFDAQYEATTGLSTHPTELMDRMAATGCYRQSCAIFVDVDKSSQTLRLYLDGRYADQWPVSTGRPGLETPNFDKRFDGRIFQYYMSSKFPGGDWHGLGNMPYAMFISGGVAIHGVPQYEWSMLGRQASHGCIRIHPDHAQYLNGLLRRMGVANSWVVVH